MTFQIVFNLYPFGEQACLPSANVVQTDPTGALTHIMQKATPETVPPYGIRATPTHERLLQITESLAPKNIEARFKPPKAKQPTPLAQLLANQDTKSLVETFIHRELDVFLTEIARARLPLTWHVEKKSLAKDHLVAFQKDELVPHLHFKKTPGGVEYRLQLATDDGEKWRIQDRDVVPLTNTSPAWILVGHDIFRVPGINGNMVKPFQAKDVVSIPERNVREYFQRIIVKNANRTHIEPEGFALDLREKLLGGTLTLHEDFFQKTWLLAPVFRYEGREFPFGERRRQFTWVEFPADAPIALRQVRRDEAAESALVSALEKLGLRAENRAFHFPENANLEQAIGWLAMHRAALESAGFQIVMPETEGRRIAAFAGAIALQTAVQNDWFDVFGTVTVGPFEFPFRRFAPYIRRGERHFPLPDGTFFLIPEAWLARYAELVAVAREGEDERLQVPKALFTVLETLGLAEGIAEFPEIDPEKIDFQPSARLQASLRPYQLRGVKWLIGHQTHGFGACLADDMGLGKTLQTIAVLLHAKERWTADDGRQTVDGEARQDGITNVVRQPSTVNRLPSTVSRSPSTVQLDLFAAPPPEPEPIFSDNSLKTSHSSFITHRSSFTALVVLPASLVFNWQAELDKFVSPRLFTCRHIGPKRATDARALAAHDVVLTTYHTARNDLDLLGQIEWDYIILDESQQIKNRDSEVSKVVRHLRGRHKISLSGTPIENSLADLWTQMEFINPATLGSFADFRRQFLQPIERGDAAAKAALFRRVRPFFLRRTKEEVAPELPEKTEQVFLSEMLPDQKRLYERVKSAVRNDILRLFDDPKTRILAIQALTKLRQIANHPALAGAIGNWGLETGNWELEIGNWGLEASSISDSQFPIPESGKFDDVLAQWESIRRSGHKVLIFSSFERNLRLFRAVFEQEKTPFAWLTGDTPATDRAREVERFQADPAVQAFFMTTKAGGVGLNLTAADYVFILDPWWNPAVEAQAIARAHRIGQTRPVTAIRFIARETVEEKIRQMQERKAQLGIEFFAADGDVPTLTRAEMEEILG
ncbi:MAG: DEAD/DEAH box helicase [Saprospiraceae bacterium]